MTNRVMLVMVAVVIGSTASVHADIVIFSRTTPRRWLKRDRPALAAQPTADELRRDAQRFGAGVLGGVGIDPELIAFGAHGTFGPVSPQSRVPARDRGWDRRDHHVSGHQSRLRLLVPGHEPRRQIVPLHRHRADVRPEKHRNLDVGDEIDDIDDGDDVEDEDDPNRFDFSDTDFNGGMNFIVGMRKRSGVFFEMRATAWGVSNIRLLAGFNF